MSREKTALTGVVLGIAGLFSLYALPWIGVPFGDSTEFATVNELRLEGMGEPGSIEGMLSLAFAFMHYGFLGGTVLLGVAYAGLLLRPVQRQLGEGLALAGSLAVLSLVFFGLGLVLFLVQLGRLNDESFVAEDAWYGINYLSPLLMLAFVVVAARHAGTTLPEARRAFRDASETSGVTPLPPVGGIALAGAPAAATPAPLARERQRAIDLLARARDHARALARGTDDTAMATWLRQTEAYLDALTARARDAKDAATLAGVERDVEQHVLRHG